LTLDENLCWKSNTDAICKKISSGIFALKHIKEFVDQKTLISVYSAIIQPYYRILLWSLECIRRHSINTFTKIS
jgi:hypothetical protein